MLKKDPGSSKIQSTNAVGLYILYVYLYNILLNGKTSMVQLEISEHSKLVDNDP